MESTRSAVVSESAHQRIHRGGLIRPSNPGLSVGACARESVPRRIACLVAAPLSAIRYLLIRFDACRILAQRGKRGHSRFLRGTVILPFGPTPAPQPAGTGKPPPRPRRQSVCPPPRNA